MSSPDVASDRYALLSYADRTEGVVRTQVGYIGGITERPTYEEVCSGQTGHTEACLVVFDPEKIAFTDLLKQFWEVLVGV